MRIPKTPDEIVEFMLEWMTLEEAKEIADNRIIELKQQKPENYQMTKHAEEIDFFLQVLNELTNHGKTDF